MGDTVSSQPAASEPSEKENLRPARRSAWAWSLFLFPAVSGLCFDLWTKAMAFPTEDLRAFLDGQGGGPGVHPYEPAVPIIPGVLGFRTIVNYGAVFGVGQHRNWVFISFSFVAIAAIFWVFAASKARQMWLHVALGLILGGAIGNLYDRLIFGCVRDFLLFFVSWYPYIFNIADVLLCIGVPLLMICWIRSPSAPDRQASGFPVVDAKKEP